MSAKGKKRQALRVLKQQINKQENQQHYQNEGNWKSPSSDRERAERRTIRN